MIEESNPSRVLEVVIFTFSLLFGKGGISARVGGKGG